MRIRDSRGGLSLAEVVVATGILVLVILTLFSLLIGSQKLTRTSAERVKAEVMVNARIAELRALLRASPNDSTGTGFQRVIDSIGTVDSATGVVGAALPLVNGTGTATTLELGKTAAGASLGVSAEIWVYAITQESLAQSQLGITNVDLDMDGTYNELTITPAANGDLGLYHYLPVVVVVRWTSGEKDGAPRISEVRVGTLLY